MSIQTHTIQKMISSIKPLNSLPRYSEEIQKNTNCYAYALGITYPDFKRDFYYPGFTQNLNYKDAQSMIKCIEKDLTRLGLKFRTTACDEFPIPDYDEYIIKAFLSNKTEQMPNGDFHFARRLPNGKWSHKLGWLDDPCIIVSSDGVYEYYGYEPDDMLFIEASSNTKYKYQPVCYFAIKQK